jgi:hypothetical protein
MTDEPTPVFRCDLCDQPAMAIEPGCAAVVACDLFRLTRETPRRQRCVAHWPTIWRTAT